MNAKLLPVLDEIAAILKKNDLAGSIEITDGDTVDHRLVLDASWTCAFDEHDPAGNLMATRIRCTPEMEPDKLKRKAMIEKTTGAVIGLITAHDYQHEQLFQVASMISHHFEIESVNRRLDPSGPPPTN